LHDNTGEKTPQPRQKNKGLIEETPEITNTNCRQTPRNWIKLQDNLNAKEKLIEEERLYYKTVRMYKKMKIIHWNISKQSHLMYGLKKYEDELFNHLKEFTGNIHPSMKVSDPQYLKQWHAAPRFQRQISHVREKQQIPNGA